MCGPNCKTNSHRNMAPSSECLFGVVTYRSTANTILQSKTRTITRKRKRKKPNDDKAQKGCNKEREENGKAEMRGPSSEGQILKAG